MLHPVNVLTLCIFWCKIYFQSLNHTLSPYIGCVERAILFRTVSMHCGIKRIIALCLCNKMIHDIVTNFLAEIFLCYTTSGGGLGRSSILEKCLFIYSGYCEIAGISRDK